MSELLGVVTITEAAQMFQLSIWAIHYRIDKGHVRYRKTERVYLVNLSDLIDLYGPPINPQKVNGELTKTAPRRKSPSRLVQNPIP